MLTLLKFIAKASLLALAFCYLSLYLSYFIDILNLLTPFVFHYFIVSLFLIALLIVTRQKNATLLCIVLSTLFAGEYIFANKLFNHMESNVNENAINVISYNQFRYNNQAAAILDSHEAKNADIIAIFEANRTTADKAKINKRLFPYQHHVLGYSSKSTLILSKYPLIHTEQIQIKPNDPAKNYVLKFLARTPLSEGFTQFYTIHTKAPVPIIRIGARNEELRFLSELIDKDRKEYSYPTIVMGDFNITPYNWHFKRMRHRSFLHQGKLHLKPPLSWPSFLPDILRIQIDHILASSGLTIQNYRPIGAYDSDHIALAATISTAN